MSQAAGQAAGQAARQSSCNQPARQPAAPLRSRRGAYTLIEVLATVTILGIAAAVVVPRMGSRADFEVAAASRQILSDLDLARSEAITRNMPVYISFTTATGPGGMYYVCKALPTTYLTNPVTQSNWIVQFGAGNWKQIQVETVNFDSKYVLMFDETGAPYSCTSAGVPSALGTGTIKVTCRGKSQTISIEPLTGALKVQ